MNQLYFGDNLTILKDLYKKHPEGFIDLIYIDPPFNSKRNYNVLFEAIDMKDTKAQKEAFADTWSNVSYLDTLNEIKDLDLDLFKFIDALDNIRISKGAISYLTTMAIRIYYMHKLLKDTGSFYLHCDPTMSHYLKVLCDLIFGEKNFINEISWRRSGRRSSMSKIFRKAHDVILLYSSSDNYKFIMHFKEHDEKLKNKYTQFDGRGQYRLVPLMASGISKGETGKPWRGFDPNTRGKAGMHWLTIHENLEKYVENNLVEFPKKESGVPQLKYYLKTNKGVPFEDFWDDIDVINSMGNESLGYPTQKPITLMERIINVSSSDGDIVADFFCGCGTTISAAEKLKRQWIGADISHLAIKLISKRLIDTYGPEIRKTYEIFGFPKDIDSARELAITSDKGRFKFEEWIVEVMLHGILNPKKTETGFDGYFTLDVQGKKDIVMIEVKSGNATITQLNHFIKTTESKGGHAGIFVCFADQVTRGMRESAKKQGYYRSESFQSKYDKIQIMTVEDLMDGKLANLPSFEQTTFKTAAKETKEKVDQGKLFD